MPLNPVDKRLFEHLQVEYGERVGDFLQTAQLLLSSGLELPRLGGAVMYCLREALKAILDSSDLRGGEWRKVSREAIRAFDRYAEARNLPGEDIQRAFDELSERMRDIDGFHQKANLAYQQLDEVFVYRTGSGPLPFAHGRFHDLWDQVNSGLHRDVSIESSREAWSETLAVLRQLFMPSEVRRPEIERLAQLPDPSLDDLKELTGLLATPNDHRAFFLRVNSPTWLPLLYESGHLAPPEAGGMWPAAAAFERLAADYPQDVEYWFERIYADSGQTPAVAGVLTWASCRVGRPALSVALQALKDHPRHTNLVMFGASAVEDHVPAQDDLVAEFADVILNRDQKSAWAHFKPLLRHLAEVTNETNAVSRIELLCNKLRTVERFDLDRFQHDVGGFIAEVAHDPPYPSRGSVLLAGLVDLLSAAQEFLSAAELLKTLRKLPSSLARVRSWALATSSDAQCDLQVAEVEKAISSRFPTGDDMRLIDQIVQNCESSSYASTWSDALGSAPAIDQVGSALAALDIPRDWLRNRNWIALLPQEATGDWQSTCAILDSQYGPGH